MKCREAHQLVVRSQDSRLPLRLRIAVRFHLAICRACSNFRQQMNFLREACRHFPGNDPRR